MDALRADLNKSEFEAYSTEIGVVLNEIRFVKKHLRKWMQPKRVKTPMTHFGASSRIYPEPYGVSLIIAPWNFPFQLSIAPIIGAIAAGNCVILKPSEFTPKTSALLTDMISANFGREFITVFEGGIKTNQALLKKPFDYIFFTGSPQVGKIVMKAASEHLIPITLELGGKSPCIIHEDAELKLAAKRIAWGKFLNAGQTCIAPDYVYVHETVKDDFLQLLKEEVANLYGTDVLTNENYSHIVNENHFNRLKALFNDGEIFFGGNVDEEKNKIEPTVMTDVSWEDDVMKGEIFGPILLVLIFENLVVVGDGISNSPSSYDISIY